MKENGELPGGQIPVYVDEEGRRLNQTNSLLLMLDRKHNLYQKDIWAGYEDDWSLDHFGDIWKGSFYLLWRDEKLTPEQIQGAKETFVKWNNVLEQKFQQLGQLYIGGNSPTVGDFILFSFYADMIYNDHVKVPDLRNCLKEEMVFTPTVQEWITRMQNELKDYLAKRPPRPF